MSLYGRLCVCNRVPPCERQCEYQYERQCQRPVSMYAYESVFVCGPVCWSVQKNVGVSIFGTRGVLILVSCGAES